MAELGRPTLYCAEIATEICDRLAEGETLRRMCAEHDHLPERHTVTRWLVRYPDFCARVADARAAGSYAMIEEAREIADDGYNDWMERHGKDNVGWQLNGEHVQRSRLRIEQRRWEAEAHLPKVYGKKQQIEHSGAVGVVLAGTDDGELIQELMALVDTGRLKLPKGVDLVEIEDEEPGTTAEEDDEYDYV